MRLFFGLSLPDSIRREAQRRAGAAALLIPGRYGSAENYHITLAFLGDVPAERVSDASGVLTKCVSDMPAPRLTLGGTAFFGRAQNAILILDVISDPPLAALHDSLVHGLDAKGLCFSPGPFSPHITLARHAAVPEDRLHTLTGPAVSFVPERAHLFLSARNEAGQIAYTPIFDAYFAR